MSYGRGVEGNLSHSKVMASDRNKGGREKETEETVKEETNGAKYCQSGRCFSREDSDGVKTLNL